MPREQCHTRNTTLCPRCAHTHCGTAATEFGSRRVSKERNVQTGQTGRGEESAALIGIKRPKLDQPRRHHRRQVGPVTIHRVRAQSP